jgi:hypothetical protein
LSQGPISIRSRMAELSPAAFRDTYGRSLIRINVKAPHRSRIFRSGY